MSDKLKKNLKREKEKAQITNIIKIRSYHTYNIETLLQVITHTLVNEMEILDKIHKVLEKYNL